MKGSKPLALVAAVLALPTIISFATANDEDVEDDVDDLYESSFELSSEFESMGNYRFDDDESLLDSRRQSVLLELNYKHPLKLNDHLTGFMALTAGAQNSNNDVKESNKENFVELEELWLSQDFSNSTQAWLGRREIVDESAWWWDESLLGMGVSFENDRHTSSLTTAISSKPWSSTNVPFEPDEKSLILVLGSHETQINDWSKFAVFVHHQSDASSSYQSEQSIPESQFDESDETLTWVGARFEQDLIRSSPGHLWLSLDAAWMTGKSIEYELEETDEDSDLKIISDKTITSISGWGVNSWIRWQPSFFNGTEFSLGYAYGTGTNNRQAEGSRTFRQTGLQSNTSDDVAYFGRLSQPELSNLSITSLLVRQNVFSVGRIRGQLNDYRRASIYDDELDWEINLEPQSRNHNLGLEVSLGYEHDFSNGLSTEAQLARFYPGDAFAPLDAKPIDRYLINLSYEF